MAYYITRPYRNNRIEELSESLVMGWRSILRDLPALYNVYMGDIDKSLWEEWCDVILFPEQLSFDDLFSQIIDQYDKTVNGSQMATPAIKEILDILRIQIGYDFDCFHEQWCDDDTLWELDADNRELSRKFRKAKLLCPLNRSSEAILYRNRKNLKRTDRWLGQLQRVLDAPPPCPLPPKKPRFF